MTQAKDIDNIDIEGLTTEEKSPHIEAKKEDENGQIRTDGEGLSEGELSGEVSATEEGKLPGSVLPGQGGTGIRGEGKPDGGGDEGLRGERNRDQRHADYTITTPDRLGIGLISNSPK